MNELQNAPDTLMKIFPEAATPEERALLFLELKNKFGSFRATADELNKIHGSAIHHNTVKKLYKFLQDTTVYQEYQWEIAQQVQSFFQKEVLTGIFNQYRDELKRLETIIAHYMGKIEYETALPFIREKRMLTKDMLDAALNCQKVIPPKGTEMPQLPESPKPNRDIMSDVENFEKHQRVIGQA